MSEKSVPYHIRLFNTPFLNAYILLFNSISIPDSSSLLAIATTTARAVAATQKSEAGEKWNYNLSQKPEQRVIKMTNIFIKMLIRELFLSYLNSLFINYIKWFM